VSNQDTTPIEDAEELQAADDSAEAEIMDEALSQAESEDSTGVDQSQALDEAIQQAQAYFQGWQRERADFNNYKKRAERDLMTMRFNAKIDTLKALLPVLDDFERAMENQPEDLEASTWLEGITAIQRKLAKAFEDEGIQVIDPAGEVFDPNLHEAIGRETHSEIESGRITATLQKGYVCGDRVLRPALVRVAE
jgi:molecular chaperone GrpE